MDRVEPPAVGVAVHAAGGGEVFRTVGGRVHRGEVGDDADLRRRGRCADCPGGQAVAEEEVVGGADGGREVGQAGGHLPLQVADPGRAQGLVERGPVVDPVPQPPGHDRGVRREVLGGFACGPAAAVLEHLGQVPVVEGDGRGDAGGQQGVDQPVVEVEALGVDRAVPARDHARPGDGQAVGVGAQPAHEVDVLAPAVVVVAGDVAGVAARDLARGVREGVPDRRRTAVLRHGSLDLVGRRGRAPQEVVRECGEVDGHESPFTVGHLTAPAVSPATR